MSLKQKNAVMPEREILNSNYKSHLKSLLEWFMVLKNDQKKLGSSQESVHEFGFGKVTHTMV